MVSNQVAHVIEGTQPTCEYRALSFSIDSSYRIFRRYRQDVEKMSAEVDDFHNDPDGYRFPVPCLVVLHKSLHQKPVLAGRDVLKTRAGMHLGRYHVVVYRIHARSAFLSSLSSISRPRSASS